MTSPSPSFLDSMLEAPAAAKWMRISIKFLMRLTRCKVIPCVRLGAQTLRWVPRMILAKKHRDAGMDFETIAASFGDGDLQFKDLKGKR